MSYILFEHNIDEVEKRISKIDDLLLLFSSGDSYDILNNAKELLKEKKMATPNKLFPEIIEALKDPLIISEMNRNEFKFKLAQDALENLTNFQNSNPDFFKIQKEKFKGVGLIEYLNSLDTNTEEFKLFKLIAELYSYCDNKMPNKQSFNEYDDLRTIADSGIWQYAWVVNLLKYKIEGNSIENLTPSIKNALLYLIDPTISNTMLNVKHRVLFCDVFLNGKSYDNTTFIVDYLNFFEPYGIKNSVINPLNYTQILDLILYSKKLTVRSLWVDNNKQVVKSSKSTNDNIFKSFKDNTKSIGLIFTENQILRYITSLCTKPFVILTGLSGSGKTKLAQSFSKWLCTDIKQYSIVAVGADWTNREPLLGYPNSLVDGQYVTPESGVLDLILRAIENYNTEKIISNHIEDISNCKPYFLILDEMNLSHVERYFSDFLSAMESGDDIKLYTGNSRSDNKGNIIPSSFKLPPNLYIVGTVNIDETTYMFSPKVLDRANTIEFRIEENELNEFFKSTKSIKLDDLEEIRQEIYETEFMMMSARKRIDLEDNVKNIFISYFNVLKTAGAEFGYRTLNEMAILINFISETYDPNNDKEKKGLNNAIDIAIMQKLLPKLHGSRSKMLKILPTLCELCIDKSAGDSKSILDTYLNDSSISFGSVKYQLSFNKICRMYKNAIENGFTSYAEA
jgi:5-methylcytosine-specific restriction protein B